jgi:hypothetical protein
MDSSGKSRLVVFNSEGIAGLLCEEGCVPGRTLAPSAKQQLTSFEGRHDGQKNHETDLGDQGRSAGKTTETEKCSDERDDEEDNGVVKHGGR